LGSVCIWDDEGQRLLYNGRRYRSVPVSGSWNFARKYPCFGVLEREAYPRFGVLAGPCFGVLEFHFALHGLGKYFFPLVYSVGFFKSMAPTMVEEGEAVLAHHSSSCLIATIAALDQSYDPGGLQLAQSGGYVVVSRCRG
jgi:hypothetical protein